MKITFLEANTPLVKHYTPTEKRSYPYAKDFTSHEYTVATLQDMETLIQKHAAAGHCLLKGNLDRSLRNESRAGHTDSDATTEWICLDIDGLPSMQSPDQFLTTIGLGDIDYIRQWSASFGVYGNVAMRLHLFMQLDQPTKPANIKQWLKQTNLHKFGNDLQLTSTAMALRWGLDLTTCQNDKLLYIAPPTFSDPSLCSFTGPRITFVQKQKRQVAQSQVTTTLMPAVLRSQEHDKINELRKAQGLKSKNESKLNTTSAAGHVVLKNPDQAVVSGIKKERGFTYLNINGGDSFAYYHPDDNFEFIHNFKGEPSYITKELVPDYHADMVRQARKNALQGRTVLAFRDRTTATYWNGMYDPATGQVDLYPAKGETQINHWLIEHRMPPHTSIPVWDRTFDPTTNKVIDTQAQWVNLFKPTPYMLMKPSLVIAQAQTPVIDALINNIVGPEMYDHFINWLAFMFQFRERPMTAWILHGVQGTGKGVMFNKVIRPLFGYEHTPEVRMSQLKEQFNGWMEAALVPFIDEIQVSETGKAGEIMADLKNIIVEPTKTIRRMRTDSYEVNNYMGMILGSNMKDPVVVSTTDRRFNVGVFQRVPLLQLLSSQQIENQIPAELTTFAHKLHLYPVDKQRAYTAMMTESKRKVQRASQQSVDILAQAVRDGDMEELISMLPNADTHDPEAVYYKGLIKRLLGSRRTNIARDELRIIFRYCIGRNVPESPAKFSRYLSHHDIEMVPVRIDGKVVRGFRLEGGWKQDELWFKRTLADIESPTQEKQPHGFTQTLSSPQSD